MNDILGNLLSGKIVNKNLLLFFWLEVEMDNVY